MNALVALIGIGLVFSGFSTFTGHNRAMQNPVNVTATVIDTSIERDSSRRGGIDYQPEIRFRYTYQGAEYTSNDMYPGGQLPKERNTESGAKEVVQNYGEGTEVQVLVPPETPGKAFIRAKKTNDPLVFMALGLLMLSPGAYMFLRS
ncbi:MAG: DUF3592 domain-containing protein [Candidatus Aenigmatarchaeota archaeon]